VAVASSGLGHISRGVETWAADLGAALHDRDLPVTLYQGGGAPPPWGRVIRSIPRESGVRPAWSRLVPKSLAWRIGTNDPYTLEQNTFAWSLFQALRKDPVDILHVQDPLVALRLDQCRRIGLLRTRTILAHGTEENDQFLMRFRYVQHLAPTHLERSRAHGAWRPTWTAIGNFVDVQRFAPGPGSEIRHELGIPANTPMVLAVAAIKRVHKRIDWLVEAMAHYRERYPVAAPVLVVAGGSDPETEDLIREGTARLGDGVRFLLRYPRERIPELYRAADVFVLASLFEMMPIALIEAAASGLPCLIHPEPTLQWMTGSGGIATPMDDKDRFAESLHQVLSDATERQRIGAEARQHAVREFATDRIVDRILEYYTTVMADTP
jgi:1,2-diacylglycerol 3-alpha-glucosyltransferase